MARGLFVCKFVINPTLKTIFILAAIVIPSYTSFGQNDTLGPQWPNQKFVRYIYNPQTKSTNASYDYSGLWDLDGDGIKDSVLFIGNSGAHTYFYLRIILSTEGTRQDFTTTYLDMPYLETIGNLKIMGKSPGVQFVVHDFDDDGILEMYLNFDNPFGSIPQSWKKKGVNSKYVILDFSEKKPVVKGYR